MSRPNFGSNFDNQRRARLTQVQQTAQVKKLLREGLALQVQGKFVEAELRYKSALAINPNSPEALNMMGLVLLNAQRAGDAHEYFRRAVKISPKENIYRIHLGRALENLGKLGEAEIQFRHVLARDALNEQALRGLANCRKFRPGDPEPALMLKRLTQPFESPVTRSRMLHAAGKAFADIGDYDISFAQFAEAKKEEGADFDLAQTHAFHAAMVETFTPDFFAARRDFGLPTEQPVFVVGMPRSGTTLIEQICSSHSQVGAAGELGDIERVARRLLVGKWDGAEFVRLVAGMSPHKSRELAQIYLFELQRAGGGPGRARIIDKLPHNFEFLGFIALLFPNARIIHSRRDPIDTCVSCFTHNFTAFHGYNRDLRTLGLYYREYASFMDQWREVLPLKMYENSYESLVADQEVQSRALISFLGLEWEDGVLRFHETERAVHTPSAWQVRQPIYKSSMKAWKKYEKHLGPLIEALGDLAEV